MHLLPVISDTLPLVYEVRSFRSYYSSFVPTRRSNACTVSIEGRDDMAPICVALLALLLMNAEESVS